MELRWKVRRLALKETFAIAHGNYDSRQSLLVEITHGGKSGYGECVEISYYGIVLADFYDALSGLSKLLKSQELVHPSKFYEFLTVFSAHPFLRSAVDCAYWDLYGKVFEKSFAELNGLQGKLPQSSLTLSCMPVDLQIEKLKQTPWDHFKVKCVGWDPQRVQALLETGKKIALDANTSFSPKDCEEISLSELGRELTYIEQPLKIGQYESLSSRDSCNWMADEDLQDDLQLDQLVGHYQSINIKLMKCGGLTPALALIKKAKSKGFKIMIGCMTESSVGISAGIALASLCDYADLDGAELIANDDATGSYVRNGTLSLAEGPGLGITMNTGVIT